MAIALNEHPQAFGAGHLLNWRADFSLEAGPRSQSAADKPAVLDPVLTRESPTTIILTFGDIAGFRIDFAAQLVRLVSVSPEADPATIDHLLNDHVAPRIIAQLGALVLHGSAVEIGGRLAIFMGNTGAGKSTLAASLMKRGHRLLGDDAVVITQTAAGWLGEAVYPSLRLFPKSINEVFAESIPTDAMAYYSDKRLVRADALRAERPEAVPLGMIFLLTSGDAGVSHARLGPADACMVLVQNSFTLDPADALAAAERMKRAAGLAAAVPCAELAYPYDFGILDEVCCHVATLMGDGQNLPAKPAPGPDGAA